MTDPPDREQLPARILVVDDDADLRQLIARVLRDDEPRQIEEADSALSARAILGARDFDLVITDLNMPGEGGLDLMRWGQARHPGSAWIVLTGHGSFDSAVEALQLGAFDFLSKPLGSFASLRKAVGNALLQQRLIADRSRLHAELRKSNEQLRENVDRLEEACRLLEGQALAMRADLYQAAIIQRALLPSTPPHHPGFHVQAYYRPSQDVGGDLYDVVRLGEDRLALLVADAAGHGLSAAMLAVLFHCQLPLASEEVPEPREVLATVNRALCEALPAPGLFLTTAYCVFDAGSRRASIASAGHPPVLWLRGRGGVERIFHTGPALGLDGAAKFAQQEITLEPEDRLLFYSDGLYARFPGEGETSARIADAFEGIAGTHANALAELIARGSGRENGAAPPDDVTALMLTAAPGSSAFDNGVARPPVAAEMPERPSEMLVGWDARRKALCLQGRGDWTGSAAFHRECATALEQGLDVLVDLTLCRHLDSTFLGTIHQLCGLAERAGVELRLQGVTPPVEQLFEELGMRDTIDHMAPCMLPLPTNMKPLGVWETDPSESAGLLLRAHEGLAALNTRNAREFDPLLVQLRREIGEPG